MTDDAPSGAPKPVVLIVIDGLTPSMLEATDAPALRFLLEHGSYRRAASAFPSLTPVCLASIATGGHPDVHGIPHLVWWNRSEDRLVEYGSSFAALRASGLVQGLRDTVVNLNERHLLRSAETVYEALEGAGLTTAAINITTYRGRHRHLSPIPGFPPVHGPKRFFFYSVYESDKTGAPIAWLNRSLGSIDGYAAAIGRWLVTRDAFDLLVYYLPDYDYASHALGPDAAHEALGRADASIGALFEAAGGRDRFLERYAVVLCSDHGQAPVEQAARLEVAGALVAASNRAAMLYGDDPRRLAEALDGEPSVDVALFLEHGELVARREGDEDLAILDDYPDGRARAEGALRNPNAGEVLLSAAPGWEFADLGGRSHSGGGSHGALAAPDSEVPMLTVGIDGPTPASITDIKGLLLAHFGLAVARAA
ncbi:MAG TPA: alkaline phosphatase family protein [Gaiellaceae bacterium]|nr:alkaline phosphatase family protein [Gaiellaceae bacterium]